MSTNNLGSLTVNVVANLGQYTAPIEKAERLTQRAMRAMGISIDEFGNYTDKAMKKAVESTQQLDAQFEKLSDNLAREVALYGETSRAAQLRYDLEKGALQNLSALQKEALTDMTRRLSAMESANAAFREQAAIIQQLDSSHDQLAAGMQKEIELYGQVTRAAKLRYDLEKGSLKGLTDQQKYSLTSRASILDAMDKEAAKAREAASATKQLNSQHDQLNEVMLAQLATYGQVTRVAKLRYDMERGSLKGLTEAQKQSSLQLASQLDSLDKAAQGSMRGIRGMATGIGYQMQDIAVQLQMGTNPLMVFAQQGSQIASLFGPGGAVVGAVIAIGGALAGALLPSLFKTGAAADEVSDKIAGLVAEMDNLNDRQQKIVQTANQYRISDKAKEYDVLTKSIEAQRKEVERLNEENGFVRFNTQPMMSGMGASLPGSGLVDIENAQKLVEANRKLEESQANLVAIERELQGLRDPAKLRENLNTMQQELELLGLTSAALFDKEASQKGYTGALAEEYVYLKMVSEETEKRLKLEEEAKKSAEDAAKKAIADEKARAEAIAKTVQGMEREIALMGETSRVAQVVYDITNGIIDAKGKEVTQLTEVARAWDLATEKYKESQDQLKANEDLAKSISSYAERAEKEKEALDAWVESVDEFGGAWSRTGSIVVDALGGIGDALDDYSSKMQAIAKEQEIANQNKILFKGQTVELEKIAKAEKKLAAERTSANIKSFGAISGAASEMFSEQSKARKAFHAIEKTLAAIEIAMAIKNTATELALSATRQTAATAEAGTNVAAGGAKMFAQSGWGGFAGVAAMVAAMAALGFSSSGGGSGQSPAEIQEAQGTGTVFGSKDKSESILNAFEMYSDIGLEQLSELRGIRDALTGLSSGIALLARDFVSGGNFQGMDVSGLGTTLNDGSKLWGGAVSNILKDFDVLGVSDKILGDLFGSTKKSLKDSGLQFSDQELGDILAGNFEAYFYDTIETTKKKLFGLSKKTSSKDQLTGIDSALEDQISGIFGYIGVVVGQSVESLGVETANALEDFRISIGKVSFKDLSGEEIQAELEAIFSQQADLITEFVVPAMKEYQVMGEGLFETLTRITSEMATFNYYTDALGLNFKAVGIEAIDAQQAIAELSGGMDKLVDNMNTYYEEFFSEEERAAKQMEKLTEVFNDFGLGTVPATRAAFRQLVEGLDLTKKSDQELFSTLIALSGAFADLVDDGEIAEGFINGVRDAFSMLEASISQERKVIQDANSVAVAAITQSLQKHRALANALSSALGSMTLESEKYQEQSRRQAQAELIAANAIRRAGGPLPDLEALAPALSALSKTNTNAFSTFEDYARDFYVTQNALKELQASTGVQVSVEEQMLKNQEEYFEDEMARLDEMLEYYQKQLDVLEGVDQSVISVAEAVNKLIAAFSNAGVDVGVPLQAIIPKVVNPRMVAITEKSVTSDSFSSPVVNQSFADLLVEIRGLRGDLEVSQYAIAKNTQQSNTVLQRWEVDGMPPEREAI